MKVGLSYLGPALILLSNVIIFAFPARAHPALSCELALDRAKSESHGERILVILKANLLYPQMNTGIGLMGLGHYLMAPHRPSIMHDEISDEDVQLAARFMNSAHIAQRIPARFAVSSAHENVVDPNAKVVSAHRLRSLLGGSWGTPVSGMYKIILKLRHDSFSDYTDRLGVDNLWARVDQAVTDFLNDPASSREQEILRRLGRSILVGLQSSKANVAAQLYRAGLTSRFNKEATSFTGAISRDKLYHILIDEIKLQLESEFVELAMSDRQILVDGLLDAIPNY